MPQILSGEQYNPNHHQNLVLVFQSSEIYGVSVVTWPGDDVDAGVWSGEHPAVVVE